MKTKLPSFLAREYWRGDLAMISSKHQVKEYVLKGLGNPADGEADDLQPRSLGKGFDTRQGDAS